MGWLDFKDKATNSADWARTIELIDNLTNQPYDGSALDFTLHVTENGSLLLEATTDAGTITRPSATEITFRFTKDQMAGLCPAKTYDVGCVWVDGDGNTEQFIVGEVAIVSGHMAR